LHVCECVCDKRWPRYVVHAILCVILSERPGSLNRR